MLSRTRRRQTAEGVTEQQITRLTLTVPNEVAARLRRVAARRGETLVAIMRPWITEALEQEEERLLNKTR